MNTKTIAAASLLLLAGLAAAPLASYAADGSTVVKSVDKDSDGTIDMAEVKAAAADRFATLDTDHDGTVDTKEAGMDLAAVDPDKDGTVDKAEYETAVIANFKAADTDNDGTVDAKEMASPAGEKLEKMIAH